MAIRNGSKITERELADVVDFKLNYLGDNLSDFNKLPPTVKQGLIHTWNNELELEKLRHSEMNSK